MNFRRISPHYAWSSADNDPYVPEIWAKESLMLLFENMVIGNLVHRDFEQEVASYGDIVNTRKPGTFTMKRKTDTSAVTKQDATSTNVAVPLNQWGHVSFMIYDGEQSKSFADLVEVYLQPAMVGLAAGIDKTLLGQNPQFWHNDAGRLGLLSSTTAWQYMLEADKVMNDNNVPAMGRNLIISTAAKQNILMADTFHEADKRGDGGTALNNASLGRAAGFDIYMCQNTSDFSFGDTITADAINAGNLTAGSTAITVVTGASFAVGDWITIVGCGTPQLVTAVAGAGLTIAPGLNHAILTAAVTNGTNPGALDGAHAAGANVIEVDGFSSTNDLQVGQMIGFGTATVVADTDAKYTILEATDNTGGAFTLLLDRPLDAALVNNAIAHVSPSGAYNFGFHKNALALVSRPLALPRAGTGALAGVANYNGLSIRVTLTYDGEYQGTLVTCDLLYGVKVLDEDLGCVMFG